jgi:hypothetical protein
MSRELSRFLVLLAALACSAAPALAKVDIHVDLGRQRVTIVKNHEPPIVWKISSGRPGYETPTGRFIMQRMDADHFSDEYDGAPMPYAIFFSRGLAIHGTTQPGLGRPASHGCVRLSVDHARELYEWVEQYGAGAIEITGDATSVAQLQDDDQPPRRKSGKRARRLLRRLRSDHTRAMSFPSGNSRTRRDRRAFFQLSRKSGHARRRLDRF